MPPDRLVIIVTGATASGKTDLAMALADRLPVALVSADSAMIYRGLDIGTAKPTAAELARYPHALVDILDPAQAWSVNDFVNDADAAVQAAFALGRIPVLVGGTMMYLRAFRDGLDELPESTPQVRAAVAQEAQSLGWPALHARLQHIDPVAAAQIHPHNPQRLSRALEVYALTGQPLSAFWGKARPATQRLQARVLQVWLDPWPRAVVHARIATRLERMFAAGFIAEVEALRARGDLHPQMASMRAVGYRQVWSGLDAGKSEAAMREDAVIATRGLARRQFTWLRGWERAGPSTAIPLVRLPSADVRANVDAVLRLAFPQGAGHSAHEKPEG